VAPPRCHARRSPAAPATAPPRDRRRARRAVRRSAAESFPRSAPAARPRFGASAGGRGGLRPWRRPNGQHREDKGTLLVKGARHKEWCACHRDGFFAADVRFACGRRLLGERRDSMTAYGKLAFVLTALLALFAQPAFAQAAPEIAGAWHGAIQTPQGSITLV